jgi:PAS domain S-box-containing protein
MSKTTILIVEDEAIVAADLEGKLRRLGYEVAGITAEGEEAVSLACRLRPHLVLMDVRLEGSIDGIEAAEAIQRRHDVPVIYLTAHSDAATLARAKRTEPFGYILKPFEERELATQIELALYKHQADREIREQREWLRVTLTSIGDAVIATDAAGYITFVNPVAESLAGWKAEEAMGRPIASVFRIVNEQTGQMVEEPVTRVLREGRTVALANHTVLVARNGCTVPIEDSAAPILDAAGQVIGAVLVFHDVTEKRRAEEAMAQLARFPEENPSPVLRIATDGGLMYANAAARAWLVGGWGWQVDIPLPEPFTALLAKAFSLAQVVEEDITCPAGRSFWMTAVHPPNEDYVTIYGREITRRKRAENEIQRQLEELQAKNEELTRFNRVAVDRELRMIELKKQINELCARIGQPVKYKLDFDQIESKQGAEILTRDIEPIP